MYFNDFMEKLEFKQVEILQVMAIDPAIAINWDCLVSLLTTLFK
ncbi:hypothetical protein OSCI_3890009 [Kamptonema sp. PCC 6506]|nr:hypothetical protein OSCI_3890009 [Kamptonema sp. PCC 6506]